ncbi:unnamed protein product [Acanthoscelides obtectus]|uniref:Endonuclease/exonuclease/phosphatase domain-containing protein n=1 Tax=Acanthoscelides obtectus TaxID=200917 RepID=A0A9P0JT00_ACAOB|nr:unnamed protein product [Acanthoscelides obtectus]CAK1663662.1 hypothetical protein AOBTE_LOCUS23782 [Acanthoscelides obtectus]
MYQLIALDLKAARKEKTTKQKESLAKIALLHQNVQSLGNSINEINQMLMDHDDCKFICITEHWKSQDQIINYGIRNFKLASCFCRKEGKHGGSAVFVSLAVQCLERSDIRSLSVVGSFECAAVKCSLNGMNFIILSIYRTPSGNMHVFLEKMEQILSKISDDSASVFIAGDFNIDFSQDSPNKQLSCSLLNSYNIQQTIFQFTRITSASESCIDNIFTNISPFVSNVINSSISDHTAQKITVMVDMNKPANAVKKRILNNERFLCRLKSVDWQNVFHIPQNDVNEQWNYFSNIFQSIFEQVFPMKTFKVTNRFTDSHHPEKIKNNIKECKDRLDVLYVISNSDNSYKPCYNKEKSTINY